MINTSKHIVDFSQFRRDWEAFEEKYKAKYIDRSVDHDVSYLELCDYIDYLLNTAQGKKKSLELIKKRFQ